MAERLIGKNREDVHKEIESFKSMMVGEEEFPDATTSPRSRAS